MKSDVNDKEEEVRRTVPNVIGNEIGSEVYSIDKQSLRDHGEEKKPWSLVVKYSIS